ncbi:MAG: hypothetical protein JWO01_2698 [Microbacteriaceae bacterium]|nr:hypothetical protein [Microbacteriaceae bacterium]
MEARRCAVPMKPLVHADIVDCMPIRQSLAFIAIGAAALLLTGCASTATARPNASASAAAQPSSTPTAAAGGALTTAGFLQTLQSFGALSALTAANVDTFSNGLCDDLSNETSTPERLASVTGVEQTAKVQFDQAKEVLELVAAQYCPDQLGAIAAVQNPG